MGVWFLSRRDSVIVARHEVPGKASSRKNRPVGYGMIGYEGEQREGLGQDAKQILPGG